MSVDRDEVARIAALARLELGAEDVRRLTADMNRILEHAAHLGEIDAPNTSTGVENGGGRSDDGISSQGFDDGVRGGRVGGPGVPDSLTVPIEALGPRVEEGFFVVPPLPGTRPGGSS